MFKKILVPIDLSSPEPGVRSCPRARTIAEMFGAEVKLLTVLPGYSMPMVASYFPSDAIEKMEKESDKKLTALGAEFFSEAPGVEVRSGKRAKEIIKMADEWGADLIVFGCRPKDALGGELQLGSCGTAVAERARCSVLVAR